MEVFKYLAKHRHYEHVIILVLTSEVRDAANTALKVFKYCFKYWTY